VKSVTAKSTVSSLLVSGLVNGTTYTFTVTTVSGTSSSAESVPSDPLLVGVPLAPTAVTAQPGNNAASVSWTAPAANGTPAISSYLASALDASGNVVATGTGSTMPVTVAGLVNGSSYRFEVQARNSVGLGLLSAPSSAIEVGVPLAPTNVVGQPGNGLVTVTWTPPAANGTPAISSYATVLSLSDGTVVATKTSTSPSATFAGLTNGTAYWFVVTATNAVGTSAASAAVDGVTAGAPLAPTNVVATPVSGGVNVSWSAPAGNGTPAATSYLLVVELADGTGITYAGSSTTSYTFTGLVDGTAYKVAVFAANTNGLGPYTLSSVVVAGAPLAPTAVGAVPGSGSATVSWIAPAANGTPAVASYTVTATKAGGTPVSTTVAAPATSLTVTGLTHNASYTFTVTATNTNGNSVPSASSAPITVT
jgi:fibronectin type 3 domain-containing protein